MFCTAASLSCATVACSSARSAQSPHTFCNLPSSFTRSSSSTCSPQLLHTGMLLVPSALALPPSIHQRRRSGSLRLLLVSFHGVDAQHFVGEEADFRRDRVAIVRVLARSQDLYEHVVRAAHLGD